MAGKEEKTPQEEPEEAKTPTPGKEAEPEGKEAESEKTFTQAELNQIVKDRLARAESKFADYEDLKAKAAKLDEIEEANKSELEKARDEAEKAKAEAKAAADRANQVMLKSAVIAKASALNFIDAEDAFALLPKDSLSLSEDGQVEGLEEALKTLAEAKPHLLKSDNPRIPKINPTNPSGDDARRDGQETDAERMKRLGIG